MSTYHICHSGSGLLQSRSISPHALSSTVPHSIYHWCLFNFPFSLKFKHSFLDPPCYLASLGLCLSAWLSCTLWLLSLISEYILCLSSWVWVSSLRIIFVYHSVKNSSPSDRSSWLHILSTHISGESQHHKFIQTLQSDGLATELQFQTQVCSDTWLQIKWSLMAAVNTRNMVFYYSGCH